MASLKRMKERLTRFQARFKHWRRMILMIGGIVTQIFLVSLHWDIISPWVLEVFGDADGKFQIKELRDRFLIFGNVIAFIISVVVVILSAISPDKRSKELVTRMQAWRDQRLWHRRWTALAVMLIMTILIGFMVWGIFPDIILLQRQWSENIKGDFLNNMDLIRVLLTVFYVSENIGGDFLNTMALIRVLITACSVAALIFFMWLTGAHKRWKNPPMHFLTWFKRWWLLILTIGGIIIAGYLVWRYWQEDILPWVQRGGVPSDASDGKSDVKFDSISDVKFQGEILRNMALALGGAAAFVIGLPLAVWRSIVAHEQGKVAARGLNNERYQKGAEMLGSDMQATRIGGVVALERLAQEHPEEYHIQIVKLLCTFIRNPKKQSGRDSSVHSDKKLVEDCPGDVEAAAQAIGRRSQRQLAIEWAAKYKLDLKYCNLVRVNLYTANFSNAYMMGTDLSFANLNNVNFSGAFLNNANLSYANLSTVNFLLVYVSNANFSNAQGLTQERLNETYIRKDDKPPKLKDAIDPDTGQQLVWHDEQNIAPS